MGTDAGAHLAEEIPSPSINAPKVIVSSPYLLCNPLYIILTAKGISSNHWTDDRYNTQMAETSL